MSHSRFYFGAQSEQLSRSVVISSDKLRRRIKDWEKSGSKGKDAVNFQLFCHYEDNAVFGLLAVKNVSID